MIEINLLPWREKVKQKEIRKFKLILLISTTIILIFSLATHLALTNYQNKLHENLLEITHAAKQEHQ
jgi:Tfp pilus assembly protein PilN